MQGVKDMKTEKMEENLNYSYSEMLSIQAHF